MTRCRRGCQTVGSCSRRRGIGSVTLVSKPAQWHRDSRTRSRRRSIRPSSDAVLPWIKPTVSPDGKFVVARSSGEDIVLVSVADKTVRKLIESPFRERNPEVSRDGRWIAYQSDESGSFEVYVRPFPDVARGKWPGSEQGGTRPGWAHKSAGALISARIRRFMSVTFEASGSLFTASTPNGL